MNKRVIIWLAIAVAAFLFFYNVIPVPLLASGSWFFYLLGAAIVGGSIFMAFKPAVQNQEDINNYKTASGFEKLAIFGGVFGFIGTLFSVMIHSDTRKDNYILKNAVFAIGTIKDGESVTTKRRGSSSTSYEIQVFFNDKTGAVQQESLSVGSDVWDNVAKDMQVGVVYADGHPSLAKILIKPEDIKKYTTADKVGVPTLSNLFNILQGTSTTDYRKNLNEKFWKFDNKGSSESYIYSNEVLGDAVVLNDNIHALINDRSGSWSFDNLLAEAKKTMTTVYDSLSTNAEKGALFSNGKFEIKFERVLTQSRDEVTIGDGIKIPNMQLKPVNAVTFAKKGEMGLTYAAISSFKNTLRNSTDYENTEKTATPPEERIETAPNRKQR
jgi:hypothetical protein